MEDARRDRGGRKETPSDETGEEDDRDLHVLVVPGQREHGGRERDRAAPHVPGKPSRHAPDRERDDDERDQSEDEPDRTGRPDHSIDRVGEDEHEERRRKREAEPREERAERTGAEQTDRDADLAARRTR